MNGKAAIAAFSVSEGESPRPRPEVGEAPGSSRMLDQAIDLGKMDIPASIHDRSRLSLEAMFAMPFQVRGVRAPS